MTVGPLAPSEGAFAGRDAAPDAGALRSDFCLFLRGDVQFALSTRIAREVLEARLWTPVPLAPPDLMGAFSLRGEVVPLVRLDRFLETSGRPLERNDPVILLWAGDLRMAVAVDRVLTVRHIAPWEIRRPQEEGISDLVRGFAGPEEAQTRILDGERLLGRVAEEIALGIRAPRSLGATRVERGVIAESAASLGGDPDRAEEG
jgi:chemotaxis signal transduction protein